jgi:AcrR family transcriptional regulator
MLHDIRRAARRILAEQGEGALSLRAVAAELGVTPPALYRYYGSWDEVVRALTAELHAELTEALTEAGGASDDAGSRLIATCGALRGWALAHRAEFMLLVASPDGFRGQEAGGHEQRAGWRPIGAFSDALVRLWEDQGYPAPAESDLSPALLARLRADVELPRALPPGAKFVLLRCWSQLLGTVTIEALGHLIWAADSTDVVFESMLAGLFRELALPLPSPRRGELQVVQQCSARRRADDPAQCP